MSEINWWIWAVCWLVAWLWQNVEHEGSHLWAGWMHEGRQPTRLIPWPHVYQGRFYFARYECGPATKSGSPRYRHSAPLSWAVVQVLCVVGGIGGALAAQWVLPGATSWRTAVYLMPFAACPLVDAAVWVWGWARRRPGTDGERWREQARKDGIAW